MEFFADYASFLAKTVTLVIAIVVVLVVIAALRGKGRRRSAGQLQVNKMNEFYKGLRDTLEQMTVNLLAPIVVNWVKRTGAQLIIENKHYSVQQPLFPEGIKMKPAPKQTGQGG